ncbi:MAG TPA: hypothetical protein VHU40_20385, partial [Polyangia bacterium]|nr:hypothetical protein [Polyangia bacterium]
GQSGAADDDRRGQGQTCVQKMALRNHGEKVTRWTGSSHAVIRVAAASGRWQRKSLKLEGFDEWR